ncbi:hypothetical protein RD792_006700 [Penstemon davidsonii]|uniref:Pentatricopeptide repeat-containing protein n=1 Tax=Penstemon davidsonii TaxID=160366 RepID=A0ABR0DBS9_9LAMI|nr:hypothetical protein RD792_006700 [Penstemon davidsonii]
MNLFVESTNKNEVSWNTMIVGYVQLGDAEKAFRLYLNMCEEQVQATEVTYSSLLRASASLAALEPGIQIHTMTIKTMYDGDDAVNNALIDMYGKCGRIKDARVVFNIMSKKDVVSWNSMVSAYSMHGLGSEALNIFEDMGKTPIKPNELTFVGVLSACSNTGSLDLGQSYFASMKEDYGIEPCMEHYTCMVSLLGRLGHLEKAVKLIEEIPNDPSVMVWRALLGACVAHNNAELGKFAAEHVLEMEPQDESTYVLLSNIYAHGPRYSGGIEIGDKKKPRAVMPTPKLPKKKRSELKYALEIVQNDPEIFKQFVADLERYNDILVRQSLFVAEKIRYNRWREYRLTKTKEQIIQWKEFVAEERWVLQFLETGCLRQALDSDHFLDMIHYRLRKLAKSEAKKLQNYVPEIPAENEDPKNRAAKLALSVTLEMWAKKTRYQKGQPSSMIPLPSLQQIVFGPAIKTYEDLPEQTTSPFVPALIFTHKTVVADNGVDVVTEVNEPVQVQQKTDEKISTSSEQLPQQQTTLTDEPKETDKTPEIVPASTAIPSTSASLQPTILESIQQLIANSMKEMEDRHREQLKKFEEVALNLLSAAAAERVPKAADPSPLIVDEIANIKSEVQAIRLDVETFGARVKNNTASWRDINEVVAKAMEAQEEKTENMLKAFTTSADLILSSQIQLLLCEAVNITPVLPEEPINPADDDKKGEDGDSTTKKGADANLSADVTEKLDSAEKDGDDENTSRPDDEVTEAENDADEEPKEPVKSDNEIAASKDSAAEQLDPYVKYKRIEDIRKRFEMLEQDLSSSEQEDEDLEDEEEGETQEEKKD